nr:iron export ABC transporter permease subunit FetB [Oculatella sp. LEGE 06141]
MIQLDPIRLSWALALTAVAIGLSSWQRLGLEWNLAIATARTVVQLLVVGYVLEIVFALRSPWVVLTVIGVMLVIAATVARNRISKKVPKLMPLVSGAILVSSVLTLSYVNLVIIQPETWYEPQYLIPLAGIVFGSAMNAAAIAGERLASTINASQLEIETHLSLGATPGEAIATYRKEAVKAGLIPILNQMAVVGIVTLPGIITGQLLSGVSPFNAALYQILIMIMLSFASALTAILVTQGIFRQFFNSVAQLTLH